MPLPHMAQAIKEIVAYLETGDEDHLQEAKKNIANMEALINDYQKQVETSSKKQRRR